MKCNAFAHEKEAWRFLHRYTEFLKSPDGHVLRSNHKMHEAFRAHIHDRFARCLDLLVQEFRNYLTDFLHLGEAEVASCKGLVTECKVCDALKQVGLNKSPGLDGLPYKVYLRMSHMFVPILMDMFNHWFIQGVIPGSITKGVITLLKKGGWHVWEDLDDYRPITLLNRVKDFDPRLSEPFAACHQWSDWTTCSLSSMVWLDLCCEGKIDLRQLASGLWGPKGVKRWH